MGVLIRARARDAPTLGRAALRRARFCMEPNLGRIFNPSGVGRDSSLTGTRRLLLRVGNGEGRKVTRPSYSRAILLLQTAVLLLLVWIEKKGACSPHPSLSPHLNQSLWKLKILEPCIRPRYYQYQPTRSARGPGGQDHSFTASPVLDEPKMHPSKS